MVATRAMVGDWVADSEGVYGFTIAETQGLSDGVAVKRGEGFVKPLRVELRGLPAGVSPQQRHVAQLHQRLGHRRNGSIDPGEACDDGNTLDITVAGTTATFAIDDAGRPALHAPYPLASRTRVVGSTVSPGIFESVALLGRDAARVTALRASG